MPLLVAEGALGSRGGGGGKFMMLPICCWPWEGGEMGGGGGTAKGRDGSLWVFWYMAIGWGEPGWVAGQMEVVRCFVLFL